MPVLRCVTAALLAALLTLVSGCGGGGNDPDIGAGPIGGSSVNGVVTDPPIAGALVKLVDRTGAALSAVRSSGADGSFSLPHSAGSLEGARVIASGGHDARTGYSFQELTLMAPVRDGSIVVTPLSTLVVQEMLDRSLSLDQARNEVARRFGLDADSVLDDPATSAKLQSVSLQLTRLAATLRAEGDAFARIARALRELGGNVVLAAVILSNDGSLSQTTRDQLSRIIDDLGRLALIDVNGTADSVIDEANRLAIIRGLIGYVSERLQWLPADEVARANFFALADALWQANGRRGVPSDGVQIANMARYVIERYQLDLASLSDPDFTLPAGLSSDPAVAELARSR